MQRTLTGHLSGGSGSAKPSGHPAEEPAPCVGGWNINTVFEFNSFNPLHNVSISWLCLKNTVIFSLERKKIKLIVKLIFVVCVLRQVQLVIWLQRFWGRTTTAYLLTGGLLAAASMRWWLPVCLLKISKKRCRMKRWHVALWKTSASFNTETLMLPSRISSVAFWKRRHKIALDAGKKTL